MAISLQDVNKSKKQDSDSLLDMILKRKEAKSRLRQKGELKDRLQRPWENNAEKIEKRVSSRRRIMKPYAKSSEEFCEAKMLSKIRDRAVRLFSSINLKDL